MTNLKTELSAKTVILTSEIFDASGFQDVALKYFSWMSSQGIQLLTHISAKDSIKTFKGKSAFWALRNFAGILSTFGQDSKDRYINDLLLKVLTESHKYPITVMTTSKEMAEKIYKLKNMKSFSKQDIQVMVIEKFAPETSVQSQSPKGLSVEEIKSLLLY